jgi:hypothetical protein
MAPADQQPPAAAAEPRRGWMPSLIKATVGTGLAAAVLAGVALPWWLSNPERLSKIVASAVPELLGTVTFERVRLGWTGPIVLEGVRVVPRDGGRAPLTIDRIEGSHGLLAMLFSAGDLGRLAVDGLAVDLAFDENHGTNLEKLFAPRQAPRDDTPARPRRSAVRLRLDVEDAVVRISAPWTIEPWVSDPISVRAALAPVADGWSEWTIEPVQLLADARMEPAVAWGVLAYIAPVLADATRTSGRFSLSLDGARLPVGDPGAGTLSGVLAMHEVVLGPGPLVTSVFESLPGGLPRPPTIRVADESHVKFRLAERRVWHEGLEFGVPLADPGQRLDVNSSGSVSLGDRALDLKLVLPIPAGLWQDRPLLGALAGKRISLGVAGDLEKPQVVFDGSIRETAGQVAGELLDRLRGTPPGPRPQVPPPFPTPVPPGTAQPGAIPPAGAPPQAGGTGEAIADIVGDVLEEVARRRAERRAAEAAGEVPPPRRGRLLDRLRRPAGEVPAAPAAADE